MNNIDTIAIKKEWFADKASFDAFMYASEKVQKIAEKVANSKDHMLSIMGETIETPSAYFQINDCHSMITISGLLIVGDTHCTETGKIISSKSDVNEALNEITFLKKLSLEDIIGE